MRKPSPAMIVALLGVFLGLGGVGVAATGGNFILGQSNTAGNTTGLSSGTTTGPTLALTNTGNKPAARFSANSGVPPFSVSNATRVPSLNADLLDAHDSSYFLPTTGKAANADKLDGIDSTGFIRSAKPAPGVLVGEGWHEINAAGEPHFDFQRDSCTSGGCSGWTNFDPTKYATAAFYKAPDGVVHLKGAVATTFATGSSSCDVWTIFQLPVGYRPKLKEINVTNRQIDIGPDGWVEICPGAPVNSFDLYVLDGITFRAEQ